MTLCIDPSYLPGSFSSAQKIHLYLKCVCIWQSCWVPATVTSGIHKRKPPTLQSWKQLFPSDRKRSGRTQRPASHEISHSNTRSKIHSEFSMWCLGGSQPWQKEINSPALRDCSQPYSQALPLKLLLSRNQTVQCSCQSLLIICTKIPFHNNSSVWNFILLQS